MSKIKLGLSEDERAELQVEDQTFLVADLLEGKHTFGESSVTVYRWKEAGITWIYPIISPFAQPLEGELDLEIHHSLAAILTMDDNRETISYVPCLKKLAFGPYIIKGTDKQSLGLFDIETGILLFDLIERSQGMSRGKGKQMRFFNLDSTLGNDFCQVVLFYTVAGLVMVYSLNFLFSQRNLDGTLKEPGIVSDTFTFHMGGNVHFIDRSYSERITISENDTWMQEILDFRSNNLTLD